MIFYSKKKDKKKYDIKKSFKSNKKGVKVLKYLNFTIIFTILENIKIKKNNTIKKLKSIINPKTKKKFSTSTLFIYLNSLLKIKFLVKNIKYKKKIKKSVEYEITKKGEEALNNLENIETLIEEESEKNNIKD